MHQSGHPLNPHKSNSMPLSLLHLLPCELLDKASRVWEGRRLLQGGGMVGRRRLPWSLIVLWPVGVASRAPHGTLALRAAGGIHLCILLQWLHLPAPRCRRLSDQADDHAEEAEQATQQGRSGWKQAHCGSMGRCSAHGRQLQP